MSIITAIAQWRSQNRVVAWAQVRRVTYTVLRKVRKVSMQKHALLWGSVGMLPPLPRKFLEFRTSEIASAGFSGQVSVAKIIHISSIQETLSLLFSLLLLLITC